jgi:hypothetical protein
LAKCWIKEKIFFPSFWRENCFMPFRSKFWSQKYLLFSLLELVQQNCENTFYWTMPLYALKCLCIPRMAHLCRLEM